MLLADGETAAHVPGLAGTRIAMMAQAIEANPLSIAAAALDQANAARAAAEEANNIAEAAMMAAANGLRAGSSESTTSHTRTQQKHPN